MAHRAEQVIDAVVSILDAAIVSSVAKQRVLSYDPDMELPAISVRMGPDQPLEQQSIAFIDSILSVQIVVIAAAATEAGALTALLDLRRSIHVALMADYTLGLNFVSDTRYGGASAPEIEQTGERFAASQESLWTVPYRMNIADPA